MDLTRERISCILEPREIPLSFQTGFNLVSAAVVCAILESVSSLEPLSVITEPRYLKLMTVSSFCPLTLIRGNATGVICHQLGLLGTDFHAIVCGGFVDKFSIISSSFLENVTSFFVVVALRLLLCLHLHT